MSEGSLKPLGMAKAFSSPSESPSSINKRERRISNVTSGGVSSVNDNLIQEAQKNLEKQSKMEQKIIKLYEQMQSDKQKNIKIITKAAQRNSILVAQQIPEEDESEEVSKLPDQKIKDEMSIQVLSMFAGSMGVPDTLNEK